MTDLPTPDELGRRLAAARGYERETVGEFADRIGLHRTTLPKWEQGKVPRRSRAGAIRDYAETTNLPEEFFTINFNDLPEMVAAWRRVRDEASTAEGMVEGQESDEAPTLPPDPSGSQNEGQGPEGETG
jgi:transcriptional regulator with XRE-family HTH domain